jgi:hypothetical protein
MMSGTNLQPLPVAGTSGVAALDRRQRERSERSEPCLYTFNAVAGESFIVYAGSGLVLDISLGGMRIQLDHQPKDHGILEVRTAALRGAPSVWLLGICWIREIPTASGPKWVAGGRFLFGWCTN